jgi:hypothetical protein
MSQMSVAVHEASHAIVAISMGVKVYDVAIFADGSGVTSFGAMRFRTADDAQKLSMITMAGPVAEAIFEGMPVTREEIESEEGNSSDVAREGALRQQFDFPDVIPMVEFTVKEQWAVISTVAEKLEKEKTLSGEELMAMWK